MRQSPISKHGDTIAALRKEGKTCPQIAEHIKRLSGDVVTPRHVQEFAARHGYTKGMARKSAENLKGILPTGRLALRRDLDARQFRALEALAVKWRADTLVEAVMEIVRDHIEEEELQ